MVDKVKDYKVEQFKASGASMSRTPSDESAITLKENMSIFIVIEVLLYSL